MARERTGTVIKRQGRIYARITYTGEDGKRHDLTRRATDRKDARKIIKELLTGLEKRGEQSIQVDRTTFRSLADAYSQAKVKPAEYRGERKTSGLRSLACVRIFINALLDHFGSMKLRSITPAEIEKFKQKRLSDKTQHGTERTIASVNRELEVLRAMLRYAVNEGWLDKSPFERASTTLISKADEVKRTRTLSPDEEQRLLAVCVGKREHLRPLVIAAVDTGMRRGELLLLTWSDIDFVSRTITVRAMNTKTLKSRVVPMSTRLFLELQKLHNQFPDREAVFGLADNFKRSWGTACRLAGISDLHFHDLRATFCTRLIEAGMPIEQVAKLSGHTQLSTLYAHYLSTTAQAVERAGQLLDRINATQPQPHPLP